MAASRTAGPGVPWTAATAAVVVLLVVSALGCGRDAESQGVVPSPPPASLPIEPAWPATLPGTSALPFPPNEAEKTWLVASDKTLIAHRVGEPQFYICYYLAAHGKCTPIVGAVREAEVRAVSATSIEFICHGLGGGPFVPFPYLLIYDVASGKTEERRLLQNPRQPVEFGREGEARGQLLASVEVVREGVELRFGTAKDAMEVWPGPIPYVPHTVVRWDSQRGGLALSCAGTRPGPEVARQVAELAGGHVLGAALECSGDDTLLVLRLSEPRDYYITHTQGDLCTMTVHLGQ